MCFFYHLHVIVVEARNLSLAELVVGIVVCLNQVLVLVGEFGCVFLLD